MGDLSMNHIIPVATHYQSQLLKNVANMRGVFAADKADSLSVRNVKLIEEIAERTQIIERGVDELVNARKVANKIEDVREGRGLPRHRGAQDGGHTLPDRQARAARGGRPLDAAQVPRAALHQVAGRRRTRRRISLQAEPRRPAAAARQRKAGHIVLQNRPSCGAEQPVWHHRAARFATCWLPGGCAGRPALRTIFTAAADRKGCAPTADAQPFILDSFVLGPRLAPPLPLGRRSPILNS